MPAHAFTDVSRSPWVRAEVTHRDDGAGYATLVRAAQRGDRRAFELLWEDHAPTVRTILLTMVSGTDADDLAQEVAMSALHALPRLEKPESFAPWLSAIARNTGRDALSSRRRSPAVSLDEAHGAAYAVPAPDAGDPAEEAEILAAIRGLPECYREPLMLRLVLQMTGAEIAERTGMTEGSVRVNLCRGMKILRSRLGDGDEDDG